MAQFNNGNGNGQHPVWSNSKAITEPRCHICKSPYRTQIERELLLGHSQMSIAKKYQEEYGVLEITRKSVHTHAHKHMSVEDAALRKIIERRYQETSEDVAEAMGILLGQRSVLEILAYKGYKSAVSGQTVVEVKDLLNILKDIRSLEGNVTDVEKVEMRKDFEFFTQAVKETVPDSEWERIAVRFNELIDNSKPRLLDKLISKESLDELEIIGEAYEEE